MRIVLPLPWYSNECYNIVNDTIFGGWRVLIVSFTITLRQWAIPKAFGFIFSFDIALGARPRVFGS